MKRIIFSVAVLAVTFIYTPLAGAMDLKLDGKLALVRRSGAGLLLERLKMRSR